MEGKHHYDLLKNDASIEILSESGDSHTRDSEWSISSIAESEMSLMDFQKLSIHSKRATIVHHGDGQQYIERRDLDDGGLPFSAQFYLNGELWKLSGEDCFLISPRRYIAVVNVEGTVNLEGAVGFKEAVRTLLKHLKVEKVLLDKELEECRKKKSTLVMVLDKLADESGENIDRKQDVILLRMLLKKYVSSLNMDFKDDLKNCSRLSSEIKSTLDSYVTQALKLIQRNEFLGHFNDSSMSDGFINEAIQKALNLHRARLAVICPSFMKNKLRNLPDDRILYVTMDDMHLFTDLITLNVAIFEAAWPLIFSKFLTRVEEINDEQLADLDPLSNRIFLYVCKSMQEVAQQLGAHIKTDCPIIYGEALGWEVTNLQEESQTSYSKCLRQQLQMLAKLANHFEPGGPFRTSRFPYEFKLFQNMDEIPEPVRIWLCLLDDCMKDLVQANFDKMKMLSCFFKSYVSFVASEDFQSETLECLRTITNDALRSVAEVTSSQHDQTTPDSFSSEYDLKDRTLSQQNRTTSVSFSLEHKQMISCCLDKFPRKHFGNECDQIETTLQQIICAAMGMNVSSDVLSKFSDVFEQLLNDLSDLQIEWFIQLTPSDKGSYLQHSQFIVPVDSIWKDTEYKCFKVVDLDGFIEMYKLLHYSEEVPKNYQLKVIQVLLQNVEKLASKQIWTDGKRLSDKDLLGAMTVMVNSIRSSLVLLNEQPDYFCFEDFLLKMSKPCTQEIKEEVQDLPHIYAIDYEETLDPLLDCFEGSISKVNLINGLKIYTTQYNKHIVETARLSRENRIEQIVLHVKSKMNRRIKLAKSWTKDFKQNELPEVLAGLSAVWSIIVSENDNSSQKMTKPSHLQICYILSIFVGQDQWIQLSTHQGKEFVLGLTAALLALYGHKVEIVCFNSHLTRMYSLDWIEVFRSFSILSNISYESLQDMAMERSKEVYKKYTAYIKKCLGLHWVQNTNNHIQQKNASEDKRSVLLIEDIDIILQYYMMCEPFMRYIRPTIPGLMEVQQKLSSQNKPVDDNEIDKYINHSINPQIRDLREFLDRPRSYKILERNNPHKKVEYTNKTLFSRHLEVMKNGCCNKDRGHIELGNNPFPYPVLVKSFPLVLGFTAAPLEKDYVTMLKDLYGIHHTISESDIFQTIPIKFDSKKDFLSVDSEDWMGAIIVAIKAAIDRNCLVLVFFKGVAKMEQLQQTEYLKQLNMTAFKTVLNRENLFILDYEIHVLMVCNGHFSKDRPIHIIQTFFSDDPKEEDLIRRQAKRSHSGGSYELIFPRDCSGGITYDWHVANRVNLCNVRINRYAASNLENYNKFNKFLNLKTK